MKFPCLGIVHPSGDAEIGGRVSRIDGNVWDSSRDTHRDTKRDTNRDKHRLKNNNTSRTDLRGNGSVRLIFSHAASHARHGARNTTSRLGGDNKGLIHPTSDIYMPSCSYEGR
jgi:hypothetical protein